MDHFQTGAIKAAPFRVSPREPEVSCLAPDVTPPLCAPKEAHVEGSRRREREAPDGAAQAADVNSK